MKTYVSLLRGINVSGQKIIKMVDLKSLYESLSLENVETYIQSGNVVFKSAENDTAKLSTAIENAIRNKYGFDVPVQVITKQEVNSVVENLPFQGELAFNRLFVTFLSEIPNIVPLDEIEALKAKDDQLVFGDKTIYLYIPGGIGKSKLEHNSLERKLKVKITTRNWNTVLKLREMCATSQV